ncbi:hypothetical protein BDF19DRAFT_437105 [Syncephalis fuscata]|nr:hypothetical protein BDF19DRAFT_437105 [Syncephalis fuscata]
MEASGHIYEQRLRLSGVQLQIVVSIITFCIFTHNILVTTKMTILRSNSMFSWCCLLLAINGSTYSIMFTSMLMGYGLNCRMLVWSAGFFTSLGMFFNSLTLL